MMRFMRSWGLYLVLLAAAGAVGVATQVRGQETSSTASIRNSGPFGLKALYLYLQARGYQAVAIDHLLTESVPQKLQTLVIAAPTARPLTEAEVAALDEFVTRGGSLVYLAPRPVGRHQPLMDEWLHLRSGPQLGASVLERPWGDPAGATVNVHSLLGDKLGAHTLRVTAGSTVVVASAAATPIGSGALWWEPRGLGEVWVASGPDLAENRRIELLDNLSFWEQLAVRGPLGFLEHAHQAETPPALSAGVWTVLAQLLLCAMAFVVARGTRLGPPRPVPLESHRSAIEYIASLAQLTRRARVESELLQEQLKGLRILMHERTGIPMSWADADAALELERQLHIPAAALTELAVAAHSGASVSEQEFLRLARASARIERHLRGIIDARA